MRQEWSTDDMISAWTLVEADWALVGNKTGATRLANVAEQVALRSKHLAQLLFSSPTKGSHSVASVIVRWIVGTRELVVLVVATVAAGDLGEVDDELDPGDPFDLFEAEFDFVAEQSMRSSGAGFR